MEKRIKKKKQVRKYFKNNLFIACISYEQKYIWTTATFILSLEADAHHKKKY